MSRFYATAPGAFCKKYALSMLEIQRKRRQRRDNADIGRRKEKNAFQADSPVKRGVQRGFVTVSEDARRASEVEPGAKPLWRIFGYFLCEQKVTPPSRPQAASPLRVLHGEKITLSSVK